MSHTQENNICPNCGFETTNNYCAQCGQETHLHKETFWGLVGHFIGHYFHYDSKLWQTLKALWFSPGKLTIAWINKQRMRYIPPISLYIFISAVFFLVKFATNGSFITVNHSEKKSPVSITAQSAKKVENNTNYALPDSKFTQFLDRKAAIIQAKHGDINEYITERVDHGAPKIFFFMIPVMAMFLSMLFARRKSTNFVDHAIFALHYHCFWFSIFILDNMNFNEGVTAVVKALLLILAFIYMVVAMKNVYKIGVLRSVANTIVIGLGYGIFLVLFFILDLLIVTLTV